MDYLQDDGSIRSITTMLISNKQFKADILLTELPNRLQTIYNNRQRMTNKGIVEFVKMTSAAEPKTLRISRKTRALINDA